MKGIMLKPSEPISMEAKIKLRTQQKLKEERLKKLKEDFNNGKL